MSVTTTPETTRRTAADPAPGPAAQSARGVWGAAYRYHLRIIRAQVFTWTVVIAGIGGLVTAAFADAYPTQAARDAMAATIEGIPAFEALFGRTVEMATLEGFVLWRWGGFAVLLVAIWGMFGSTKLLRGAEEDGHLEQLRAGALTPRGLLAAVLAALFTGYAVLAVVVALTHMLAGMDAATSWMLGGGLGLLAATFASVGAVASQLAATKRAATAIVGLVLGVTFAVRVLAAGTGTPDWLWGVTPFGWMSYLHEVDGARPSILVGFTVVIAALVATAAVLARRDLHDGFIATTERSIDHARPVRNPIVLTVRSTAGQVAAWAAVIAGTGLVFGLLADDFATAMADLPDTVALAEQIGWIGLDTPEGVVASLVGGFLIVVLAAFAAAQASLIRQEEASWRVEHLLVRPLSRTAWLVGRVAVAAAAIVLLAALAALASWAGTALTGAALTAGDAALIAVNLLTLPLMFLGLGVAVFGLLPRLTAAVTYALVIGAYLVDLIGGLLELPETVLELGPFRHLAAVPVADLGVTAALVMLAVGLVAAAAGAYRFRRRDLQEA